MLASPPPRPSVQGLATQSPGFPRPSARRIAGSSRPRTPGTGPGRPPRRSAHRRCYYARPPCPAARRKTPVHAGSHRQHAQTERGQEGQEKRWKPSTFPDFSWEITVRDQYWPRPVPVSNSSPLLIVLSEPTSLSPSPSLPPSRPATSSGTSDRRKSQDLLLPAQSLHSVHLYR